MPLHANQRWEMVWRMLSGLKNENDLLRMELMLFKSQSNREKWVGEYVEEAVAEVYHLYRQEFYSDAVLGRTPTRKKRLSEARFILYTILHHIIGVPVAEIKQEYGQAANNYIARWRKIFTLIHEPGAITAVEDKQLYDRYAPKYHAAYAILKRDLQRDGHWVDAYDTSLLLTIP